MKKILTSLILVASGLAFAQVGINAGTENTDPHQLASDAVLHVENKTNEHKGVLLPSVALTSETDQTTTSGGTVTTGLMVWNDGTADLKPAGYYYWNGTKWILTGNVVGSKDSFKKFVLTKNDQTAPKGTTLIIASRNINPVRLPKMEPEDAGAIIMVHKNDANNITVEDYQGLVAGETGAVIKGVSSVRANRGSTFIWTGEYWMTTNY